MADLLDALKARIQQKFSIDKLLFYASIDVPQHVTKKNNRPIFMNQGTGRRFLGKDKRLVSAESHLITQLKMAKIAQGLKEPIKERLWVIYHFIFQREAYYTLKNTISKRLPDLSNLLELPSDTLTKALIIDDDTQIDSFDLSRRLVGDKNKLEIFILKYEP
jgi:Holliday junction resolvase RusA-like endonuclease